MIDIWIENGDKGNRFFIWNGIKKLIHVGLARF